MILKSFNGYDWIANGYSADFPDGHTRGQWTVLPTIERRPSASGLHAGGMISERTITVEFGYSIADDPGPDLSYEQAFLRLLGRLDPTNTEPRTLVAELNDGIEVDCPAMVLLPGGQTLDADVNMIEVTFLAVDPHWRKTTTTTSNALDAYNPSFVTDLTHWTSANTTVGLTVSVTRDAAIFHDAAGSQSVDITANSAGANALTDRFNTNFLPAIAGQTYTITTSARRTSLNVTPQQFAVWYDAAFALISLTSFDSFTAAVDTWERRTLAAVAPGGTAFARVFSRVLIPGAGNLGRVWFDDVVFAPRIVSSGDSFTVTNPGHARAYPIYKITPIAQRTSESATVGWKWRRTAQIFNNSTSTEKRQTKFIDLGDTTGLTTTKALANGNDLRVFHEGKELPRTLMNWDTARTFLVVVVTIPKLSSITLDIVYGNPDAGAPPTLNDPDFGDSRNNPDRFTAVDCYSTNGTATSGAATTITNTGASMTVNRFRAGFIQIVSGTGVGQRRRIASNTATVITVNRAWSPSPASGSVYVVWMSGIYADGGLATSAGTTTTLTDTAHAHGVNSLKGGTLTNVTKGESRTIASNTATVITISGTMTAPSLNDVYYVERQGCHKYGVDTSVKRASDDVWLGGWYQDSRYSPPRVIMTAADGIANAWDRYLMLRNNDDYTNWRVFPIVFGGNDTDWFNGLYAQRRLGQPTRKKEEGVADGVTISNPHGYIGAVFDYQHLNEGGVCLFTFRCRGDGGPDWAAVVDDGTTRASLTSVSAAHYDLSLDHGTPLHLYMGLLPANEIEIPSTVSANSDAEARWNTRLELFIDITNWSIGALSAETAVYDLNARLKLGTLAATAPYDQIEFGGERKRIFVPIDQSIWVRTDPDATEPPIARYDGATLIEPTPWAGITRRYIENQIGETVGTIAGNAGALPVGDTTVTVVEDEIGQLSVDLVWTDGWLG